LRVTQGTPAEVPQDVDKGCDDIQQEDDEVVVPAWDSVPRSAPEDCVGSPLAQGILESCGQFAVALLETSSGQENVAHVFIGWRRVAGEFHVLLRILVCQEDARDDKDTGTDESSEKSKPGPLPIVPHNGDGHEMSGAGEKHHVRHDIVVIGDDGAAFKVAQSQGVGTTSEDLGIAAADDE